jgi:hypothetical protein
MADLPDAALLPCLVASQAALCGSIGVCVLIDPTTVLGADEGGVSNFGVHAATVVPYSLGFVLGAALLAASGRILGRATGVRAVAGRGFEVVAGLLAAVLVSTYPYRLDVAWRDVHLAAAAGLFVAEAVLLVWLVSTVSSRRWHLVPAAVWLTGFVVAAATSLGVGHLLFAGQAVATGGFAVTAAAVTATDLSGPSRPAGPGGQAGRGRRRGGRLRGGRLRGGRLRGGRLRGERRRAGSGG